MNKKELCKRYILFIVSLFLSATGVALTKQGEMGVSPISSVANVLSIRFANITLGTWLIIWNCLLILGQILIRRKNFELVQLIQIPLSFLFGYFTDFAMWWSSYLPLNNYVSRLIVVLIGIVVLGFGISLSVIANVIMNSGEAFVKALSELLHKKFGNIKIAFDVGCVIVSVLLSLVILDGTISGTREGTVLTALLTGFVVNFFVKYLNSPFQRLLRVNS